MNISFDLKHLTIVCLMTVISCQLSQAQFTLPKVLKHPGKIQIKPLHQLNSSYRETNISISPDGKSLFFMSGRGQQRWSKSGYTVYRGKSEHDGDIWHSSKVNGKWQYPRCLPSSVNTSSGEDEPNISPDGQKVYFQSWAGGWERRGGPYYQAQRYGTRWLRPKGLGDGINQFFHDRSKRHRVKMFSRRRAVNDYATDGATMSADGKTFIVAVGVYNGKMDLYISKKGRYGRWSYLRRLSVSTGGNERSPFLAADGKTLYFASDGYGGYGGLEILKTTLNPDGSHGKVVNLGAPFNTYLDDYGFIMPASGDDAYFVRQGDIYYADVKNANPQIKPSITLMISGKVTDANSKRGIGAIITIRDANTNNIIASARSNSYTGQYAIVLPSDNPNIIQEVKKLKYSPFNKNFNPTLKNGLNEIISNVPLTPNTTIVQAGKELVLTGVITNKKTKRGMQATITVKDTRTNQVIKTVQSNSLTGLYKIKLPVNNPNFVQEVTQKDFDSFNKSFSPVLKTGLNQVISNVSLNPKIVKIAQQLVLSGIVINKQTQKGMRAKIIIRDAKTNKIIKTLYSSRNGAYKTILPVSNPNFVQVVTQKTFNTVNKKLTPVLKDGLNKVVSNISLSPNLVVTNKKKDEEAAAETGRK